MEPSMEVDRSFHGSSGNVDGSSGSFHLLTSPKTAWVSPITSMRLPANDPGGERVRACKPLRSIGVIGVQPFSYRKKKVISH